MARFTAVIFDFGGVVTSSPFEAFNRLEAERGLPHNLIRKINSADPDGNAWAQFERAEVSPEKFDSLFAAEARALGHELAGSEVLTCLSGDVRAPVVAAMDVLKRAGYRLGCITNNVPSGDGPGMAHGAGKAAIVADAMRRFEHIIESSKAGVRKPDPRIYQMMCEALGVEASCCIYLDDLGINCKPAASLGMHAIKVTGEVQMLTDLGAVLGITF
jgi:putative hydrolase of the HAD superfamily